MIPPRDGPGVGRPIHPGTGSWYPRLKRARYCQVSRYFDISTSLVSFFTRKTRVSVSRFLPMYVVAIYQLTPEAIR